MAVLSGIVQEIFSGLDRGLRKRPPSIRSEQVGSVTRVGAGIAEVEGFTELGADELVAFPRGLMGAAANISTDRAGIILFGESQMLHLGAEVRRTGRVVETPVGPNMLGRIVDALGRPRDGGRAIREADHWPVERPAPAILDRVAVDVPMHTGIKAIDAAIPIGRGQRELIIGDRQIGKTAIAVSAMLNHQSGTADSRPGLCVYCAVGQRAAGVARVIETLRREGALSRTVVVVAGSEDAPGLQYIAPYTATSIAEWFMERGEDVLIVYDDLTRHARTYRELSLLLRRPPGREAYPGDIFYIHSRLLERATHLREGLGGGSLTALPIIETQAQNISAFIPTNLISITDGQIYLSPELFEKGHLPAIDITRSVSRVGAKAQLPAFRSVAADLRLSFSQFEELEVFSRFGTRLDEDTRKKLDRGRLIREVLKQREHERLSPSEQIAILLAAGKGLLDGSSLDRIRDAERAICERVRLDASEASQRIDNGQNLGDTEREALLHAANTALAGLT
ncbi:MAG: F0F1 ATP synthase subunit alpha [Notoacmeibacter sp.]|nr:F0F1 ATP synthase subunit alpha [Notoacmeibacter sp.]